MRLLGRRVDEFVRGRPYTVLLTAALLGLAVPFCLRSDSDWDSVYLGAARHLRAGESIFQDGYLYPPASAWLVLPFSYLPHVPARLAWYAVNVVALVIVLAGAWRLTGGGRLQGEPAAPRGEHAVVALGLLAGIYYVLDTLSNQQTDLVLAALLVGGCLLLVRGRDVWAGVSFGVAAGMKCTPLLWAPYLAWRRRWWAAGMVIVVAVGINLLPDLTHPPPEGKSRLSQWVAVYLRPLAGADRDPGVWGSAINFNHSVAGVCNRWLTYERVPQGGDLVPAPRPDRISAVVLKVIVYSACLLFALAAILAAQRRTGVSAPPVGRTGVSAPPVGRTLLSGEAGEFGLVLILMLLLSPMSSKPHFCTLLLPGFFLARAAVERRDLLPRCLLAAAIVAGLLSNKDLVSRLVYDATVWYGSVFWNAVLLFAGCVAVLLRRSEAAALPKRLPLAAYASTPSAAPHPG